MLICSANQRIGFYMIGTLVVKRLVNFYSPRKILPDFEGTMLKIDISSVDLSGHFNKYVRNYITIHIKCWNVVSYFHSETKGSRFVSSH